MDLVRIDGIERRNEKRRIKEKIGKEEGKWIRKERKASDGNNRKRST